MDLAEAVYLGTAKFPPEERFGLTTQLRRGAVSIPSNIAEGQGRGAGEDFARFLRISRGVLQELDTQLILAVRLGYLPDEQYEAISNRIIEVAKLLNGLLRSL